MPLVATTYCSILFRFLSLIAYHFTNIICQWPFWVLGNICLCHQWWYLATFSSVGLCFDCLPFFEAIRFSSVTLAFILWKQNTQTFSFIISACNEQSTFTSSSIKLFVFLEVQDLFNTFFPAPQFKGIVFLCSDFLLVHLLQPYVTARKNKTWPWQYTHAFYYFVYICHSLSLK